MKPQVTPLSTHSKLDKQHKEIVADTADDGSKPLYAASGSVVQRTLKKGRRLVNVDSKPGKYVNIQGKSIPFFWAETSKGSWNLVSLYSFVKSKKVKKHETEAVEVTEESGN